MTPMMRMSTVAKTGRLTLIFASHCMVRFSVRGSVGLLDPRPVLDFARRRIDHLLAGLHALEDGDDVAELLAGLDDALFDLLVLHDVHAAQRALFVDGAKRQRGGAVGAELDSRRREHA